MRLLVVIPALGTAYGGPSRIATELAAALARRGLDVDVVTTNADGRADAQQPLGKWIKQDGYRLRYFRRLGLSEYKFSLPLLYWLVRYARQYDLAHIISLFSFPVLAAAIAFRLRRVSYLVNPQGMLEPWALRHKAWKKHAYYSLIERPFILRGARAIQALNRNEGASIKALRLRRSVFILPNGVSDTYISLHGSADVFLAQFPALRGKTLILFLHRIDPKKGLDLLAQAFRIVHSDFPNTHLVVAGPDIVGHTAQALRFFEEMGDADAVTFTGMLEGKMKGGALAACDIFVLPSYSEGFSMSVLEAMAAGLPCVITTGCNFPEAGKANAARVAAITPESFACALRELLADPAAAKAMGKRAQAFVMENYTWDQIAVRFDRMLAEITADETGVMTSALLDRDDWPRV